MARISLCFLLLIFLLLGTSVHAGNITYTDKLGRAVTLSIPVQRAVLFATYELIPVMGVWDKVVGVGRWAYDDELMKALKPDIASKIASPGSGTDINVELLMKLNPDVIITFRVGPEVLDYLENKGIKTIAIYPESFGELYEVIKMHGTLFGKEKEIARAIKEMQKISDIIEKKASKIPQNKKKRLLWLHHRPNSVAGGIGIINETLFHIGGINVASTIFPNVNVADTSIEKIIAMDPEVIFIWGHARFKPKDIIDNPQLKSVKAIKEGKVYKVPDWSTWSPRHSVVALWMAKKAYPEYFKDIDIDKVMDDFYKKVFGISYFRVKQIED